MKITYLTHVNAIIIFDGLLRYDEMNDKFHPLQDYLTKAEWLMNEYGFVQAQIVDNDSGTCIVEMERDDDYDDVAADEPAYYDDGETCGYE